MIPKKLPLTPEHPMYTQAVDAMKRYQDAQASGLPSEEIERLRQIAELQFQAVSDYQLSTLNCQSPSTH